MEPAQLSSVSMTTSATALGIILAGRVAAGAADALSLGFGPERRLTAVAIEAARNVVEHAYVDRDAGDIELSIDLAGDGSDADRGRGQPAAGDLFVTVRDSGGGCPLTPTSSEPPGLGLAMMSELSEALSIKSRRDLGTEINATIRFDRDGTALNGAGREGQPEPSGSSERSRLEFGDSTFLFSILPRVMAAHAAGRQSTVEAVTEVVSRGRKMATLLAEYFGTIGIVIDTDDTRDGAAGLRVRLGPVEASEADRLSRQLDEVLRELAHPSVGEPEDGGGSFVELRIPLH